MFGGTAYAPQFPHSPAAVFGRALHRKSDSLYRVCCRPSGICGREIENEEKKLTLSEYTSSEREKNATSPCNSVCQLLSWPAERERELCVGCGATERKGAKERAVGAPGLKNYSAHSSFINIPRMLISKFAVLIKSCWRSSLLHLIFMILQLDIYTKCRAKSGRNPVRHHSLCFFSKHKKRSSLHPTACGNITGLLTNSGHIFFVLCTMLWDLS